MIWATESEDERNARLNAKYRPDWEYQRKWHAWFAWTPVYVAPNRKAWLCWVERRLKFDRNKQPEWYFWVGALRFYEYRMPLKYGERNGLDAEAVENK